MSADLVSPPAIDPPTTAARLAAGLAAAADLPLLPTTAQQALEATRERDASLGEFARLIESDVALAATILKLANSPLYSWGRTIDNLEQAVVRLGLRECESLVVAVGMRGLANRASAAVNSCCQTLWQHSFLVGCLCRKLNRELALGHRGEEFTAGLLHDLGRVVIALHVPDAFVAADPMTFAEDDDLLFRERELLGSDHCTVGATYAERCRMPRNVISAIRHHHRPREATQAPELVELVAAADHLANHFHRGPAAGEYDVTSNLGFTLLARRLDANKIAYLEDRVPLLLKEASQVISRMGQR
jgi:putative nucleotidyltransferase with HDIG domain